MMMAGPSSSQGGVFDNPVAIADLAAALTTASSSELQQVLQERDVRKFKNRTFRLAPGTHYFNTSVEV